jgi:uncharacterized protein with PQ loop repeat
MELSLAEWVGYVASAVLIFSFLLKQVRALRIVNSMGALLFVVYGILLDMAWPIIITNAFIIAANLYRLLDKGKKK